MPAPQRDADTPHHLPAVAAELAAALSHDLILQLDHAGAVRAANPAAHAELDAPAAPLLGRHFLQLLDDGSRAKGEALLAAAGAGPSAEYELNFATGDGRIITLGCRAAPLPAKDAPSTLLIGRQLSATVATTERLIGLNRRLNALFAIASVASRSLALGSLLNEVLALALVELEAQAGAVLLIDAPVEVERAKRTRPASRARFRLAAQQGFAADYDARLPAPAAAHSDFARGAPFVIAGGADQIGLSPFSIAAPVGPLLSLVAVPIRSEDKLIGWMYAISDRYRSFEGGGLELVATIGDLMGPPVANAHLYGALLETSGQLAAVLDSIDSGVLLIDNQGIVRYANARLGRLLEIATAGWPGRPRAELLGRLLEPLDPAPALFQGDLWATTGARHRVLRRFTDAVTDANGAPAGTIEVYSDVTELHEMNRLKDEFVATAAHDLKTPVTAVKGYAQIALRMARRAGDERLLHQLEMINARSDDLTYHMDTLLDMSRLQAGRLRLDIDTLPLSELIRKLTGHFDFDLRRQHRTLDIDLTDAPLQVAWDAARIERVLINLVGNALKYSPDGGAVELRVRQLTGDLVELAVTDHGIGIPLAERERVFERFYRAPEVVSERFRGSGLGLYICRSVVEAHGGQIWAANALHGGPGTTVFVVLPRQATAGDGAEASGDR